MVSRCFFLIDSYFVKPRDGSHSPVHEPKMWDNLKGQFMNHIAEVNADLKAAGHPPLGSELTQQ